jgi:hypothetical protein
MAVIYRQLLYLSALIECRFRLTADGADTVLAIYHLLVLLWRYSVRLEPVVFQEALSVFLVPRVLVLRAEGVILGRGPLALT